MNKKTLLAFALIAAVYLLSQQFIWKNKNENQIVEKKNKQKEQIKEKQTYKIDTISEDEIRNIEQNSDITVNNNIFLENEQIKLTFSNLGATIVQIELKKYLNAEKNGNVELIPENRKTLGIQLTTEKGKKDLTKILYNYERFTSENQEEGINFYLKDDKGNVVLQEQFILKNDYLIDYNLKIDEYANVSEYMIVLDQGLNDTEKIVNRKAQSYKIVTQIDNDVKSSYSKKLKPSKMYNGKIDWATIRTKYFLIGVIPEKRLNVDRLKAININDAPGMILYTTNNYTTSDFEDHYQLYIGPSKPSLMEKIGNGFVNAAELGMMWIRGLSKIFIWFLGFLYRYIPNYGFCLMILALILKFSLWPLTHKTYESSQKMQKIQPLIKELQTKYKDDPRTMQKEIGKVYKENKVNPVGGCLPTLLQMPIFFSLYPAIKDSINLRQADFGLWLHDLSSPDPYYILPILMGLIMFAQQKLMSPQLANNNNNEELDEKQKAAQQSQKMMMYIMPIMMVFIFFKLPSGLVLYWTFFNVLTIIQQYYIKKNYNK